MARIMAESRTIILSFTYTITRDNCEDSGPGQLGRADYYSPLSYKCLNSCKHSDIQLVHSSKQTINVSLQSQRNVNEEYQ